MAHLSQVAYAALCQRNALYLVQVVDLGPYLVETNELDHDLLGLLYGVEVGLGVILDLVYPLSFTLALLFLPSLLFDQLEVVVDVLGVVQFLRPEVSLEEGGF